MGQKHPNVGSPWGWFWLFPSLTFSIDPHSGTERRHHLFEERLQRAVKKAVAQAAFASRFLAHPAPQLCHVLAAIGLRYSHGVGASGPQ